MLNYRLRQNPYWRPERPNAQEAIAHGQKDL